MNTNLKFPNLILLSVLLLTVLSACGPKVKFVAPEIDPPTDLIPTYVPKDFELISGFRIETETFLTRSALNRVDDRLPCAENLIDSFFSLKSPAGNEVLGVNYQTRDQLLLITKSSFPSGNLEAWKTAYEASYANHCDCDCPCLKIALSAPMPIRVADFQEIRTVGETPVAVLKNTSGWITVFIRGDNLLTIESGISLEENLKIVTSLLEK